MRLAANVSKDELDWRNPNMPCLWDVWDSWTNKPEIVALEPHEVVQECQYRMVAGDGPNWRNDPSYNWKRKR